MADTLSFLLSRIWPKDDFNIKLRVMISFSCLILSKIFSAFTPFSFKWIVDGIIGNKPLQFLIWTIALYAVTRVMSQVCNELRDGVFSKVTQKIVRDLGITVFEHLHKLDLDFHLNRQTGGLNRTLDRGIKGIQMFFRMSLFNLLPVLCEIMVVFIILWINYGLLYGIISLFFVVSYISYTFFITKRLIGYVRTMNESDGQANSKLIDSLLNYETVKYFNNEKLESKRLDESLKIYQKNAIKNDVFGSILNTGQSTIVALGLGIIMFFAIQEIQAKTMTIGDFVLINTLLIQLYIPLFMLGFAYREVRNSLTSMEDMFSFLKISPKLKDDPHAKEIQIIHGSVCFKNVSFSYNPDRTILKDISFDIKGGTTLAIVGETGSGKSTIGKLLFRFFDPINGEILIDDQNIQKATQESIHATIGVVPQDTVLFNDTIYYNILYGKPDSSHEDVIRAAKQAQIHDFITSLPQGYDTLVGERGLRLSGGEKQRISIARLVLKNSPIFIFDEATSALDTATEKDIQTNLNQISKGRTTIIIAHRLSTIEHADEVIVLQAGKIIEKGNHQELLEQKGAYYNLWSAQNASD